MTTRRRYTLLVFCFAIFTILAPTLILYVNGQMLDQESGRLMNTGIVSVYTSPKNADVHIDGKLVGRSPVSARFIPAGEHVIEINENGSRSWHKQLLVEASRVTRIGSSNNPLSLLANAVAESTLDKVIDFSFLLNRDMAVLIPGKVQILNLDGFNIERSIDVPAEIDRVIWKDDNQMAILLSNGASWLLDMESGEISDASDFIRHPEQLVSFQGNEIVSLDNRQLTVVDIFTKQKRVLVENVIAAESFEDTLYALVSKGIYSELWAGNVSNPVPVIADLPTFISAQIFITSGRQVLILAGGSLYHVDSALTKLAENINAAEFFGDGAILYSSNELLFYDASIRKVKLIARSDEAVSAAALFTDLGFVIAAIGNELLAIELDNRDVRQVYKLSEATATSLLRLSPDGKWLYWIDNNVLKRILLKQ